MMVVHNIFGFLGPFDHAYMAWHVLIFSAILLEPGIWLFFMTKMFLGPNHLFGRILPLKC